MFEDIILLPEQRDLLIALGEAARNIPKNKRLKFKFNESTTESWIVHWSIPNWSLDCYEGDLEILVSRGFLNPHYDANGISAFDINPEGFMYYEGIKRLAGEAPKRVQQSVVEYLSTDQFQNRHSKAFQKWQAAEQLLWNTDSDEQLSAIGHFCREAVQEFAESLVVQFKLSDAPEDKALTKLRLKAVVKRQSSAIPSTALPFLDALIVYWETIIDLVQRQAHAGQREKEPLVWEDARRLVFQTGIVMFEIDRILTLLSRRDASASGS